jgi:hypothetical protein
MTCKTNDWRIAPAGTFTDDFDWRFKLEKGDTIDCMDDELDWYKSTVLDTRVVSNQEGQQFKQIYVGYRIYDEEGSKEDEDNRKFFGWSNKYDSWCNVTEPTV